ncbi:multicopper oxidase domain-containing protein [Emticicia soli]|uniref:Multicopper oxidase domain-containing protein n=2 Tax=Emticicia soli TaxID=2027878 RepID=A0ABW5J762_9BACT
MKMFIQNIVSMVLVLSAINAAAQHEHHQPAQVQAPKTIKPVEKKTEAAKTAEGKTVVYHLYVNDTLVNYTGKARKAIAINGSIPAPALHFTEGDTAEIHVHNLMKMETSIHWHGLIVPNQYDGVPYLTTAPIKAGQTHIYKFPLVQNGTYWYHSHTELQEQSGMYGALIIHKRNEPAMKEHTIVLSDWTNEKPAEVHRRLHNATDWYAIKKKSTQDYGQAIKEGYLKTKFVNEWKRMLAMDVSDVYYDKLFINGHDSTAQTGFKAGEKIKLRIINGSASTYFWLNFAGGKLEVVANDGKDVEPVQVDRMIIAVSETYDVIVQLPENKSFEFLATAEDRTKSASLWLGDGVKVNAKPLPRLKYFEGMMMMNGMMKMNGDMDDMGMNMSNQVMDMNMVMYPEISGQPEHKHKKEPEKALEHIVTLNYGMLRATEKTNLPDAPTKVLHFELTGNMNRYVWSINNKTVSETDKILIKKGENVKIVMTNNTMMRHPMHLHGHFFRVLNGQGDYAPLKNVLDIMPMETDTLEFAATESGDWFFHCHILYHMMSGMGRIFSYENAAPNDGIPANVVLTNPEKAIRKIYKDDRALHFMANVGLESNGSDGEAMLNNTRYRLQTEWRIGTNKMMGYESESHFGRYIGKMQFLMPYVGWDMRYRMVNGEPGKANTKDNRQVFCAGIEYMLPLLIRADARIDSKGKLRFQLMREDVAITSRLRLNFMVNSDKEYMAGFRYIITKYMALSTHYDSDMGFGAGIALNY